MKEHEEIDNPWALAWYMDDQGYTPQKFSKAAALEFKAVWQKACDPECGCKAVEKTQDYATHSGKKFTAEEHAYAPAGSNPSDWKYPIGDASHVRNALARWGQHTGIPTSEEPKVYAKILAAAKKFGVEADTSDAKKKLSKVSTGATIMANEIEKAARKSLVSHLSDLKGHLDKCKAAVDGLHASGHEVAEKCMKLAGGEEKLDNESEGPLAHSGDADAATETEVKAAKAEIEKLSKAVAALTEQMTALKSAPVERAAKPEEKVVGDPSKAQPTGDPVEKLTAAKKEEEKVLELAKSAFGRRDVVQDGKVVRTEQVSADPKALAALYDKLTNARQYRASHPVRS